MARCPFVVERCATQTTGGIGACQWSRRAGKERRLQVAAGSVGVERMAARLRAGVIGTGQWARAAHLPAFASLPRIELVALAGIDPAEAASAAAEFGAAKSYASGRDLLAHERLDLVSIVTPDDRHAEDASLALAA